MAQARRVRADGRRALIAVGSALGHVAVVAVLVGAQPTPPPAVDPPPIVVQLVDPPPPPPPPPPPAPVEEHKPDVPKAKPSPAKPKPPKPAIVARQPKTPPPRNVVPVPAADVAAPEAPVEVSDAELAGAGTADSGPDGGAGGTGGSCNMPRRLQAALRKDPQVRAAVAEAHRGRALMVWNGDWVRHPGQEGAGLAAVREAIQWEVAFAPEACRKQPVRGLIVLSLNDGPGAARLAVGGGDWRWSDMLFASHPRRR
jgi:hypothetical protein